MNKENENPSNIVPGSSSAGESAKDASSPLLHDTRREFVRKSLAAGIIAAQPSILAGLIRADGGGGGGQTTTAPWGQTTVGQTTAPWTTYVQTTTSPYEDKPRTIKVSAKIYYRGPITLVPQWGLNRAFENGVPGAETRSQKAPYMLPASPGINNSFPPEIIISATHKITMTNQTVLTKVSVLASEDPVSITQIQGSFSAIRFDEKLPSGSWVSGYVISVNYKVAYPSAP